MKTFMKYFWIAECCLLVIPSTLWLVILCINRVISCGPLLHKFSFYFYPAVMLKPGFGSVAGVRIPCTASDWFAVIACYTILLLGKAVLATLVTRSRMNTWGVELTRN